MPIYSRYISAVGAGIQSINGSVIGAQQIVGSGDVTVSTVTGTGVTTVSLGTPLSTFANTSLSNLVAPTAVNVALLGTLGTNSAPAYSFTGDTNTGMFSSGADTLNFSTGGVERVQINSSGWVGVGTTPTSPLDIQANTNLTSAVYIHNSAGNAVVYLGADDQVNPPAINNGSQIELSGKYSSITPSSFRTFGRIGAFKENATPEDQSGYLALYSRPSVGLLTERMRIASTGNVGIGTTNPQAVLDLGSATLGRAITWGGSAGTARYASIFAPAAASGIVLATGFQGDAATDTYLSSFTGTYFNNAIRLEFSSASGGGIKFFTNGATAQTAGTAFVPTERMRITSAGNVLIGPNFTTPRTTFFGGTFSPQIQLEGLDNTPSSMSIVNNFNGLAQVWGLVFGRARSGVVGGLGLVADDDTLGNLYFNGSTSASLRTAAQIRGSVDGTPSDTAMPGKLQFFTVPASSLVATERMRITSTGNVGIGETSPLGRLHVSRQSSDNDIFNQCAAATPIYHGLRSQGTLASPTAVVSGNTLVNISGGGYNGSANALYKGQIAIIADENWSTTANGTRITFVTTGNTTTAATERMRIDSAGNVGVKATTFGTSAAAAFGIANGTEPSTSVADQIVMGSVDLTAGNTIPYIRSEGTGMTGAGITSTAVTHKIAIKVNGTVYYLLATTNGT